jgi:hypothetical protein
MMLPAWIVNDTDMRHVKVIAVRAVFGSRLLARLEMVDRVRRLHAGTHDGQDSDSDGEQIAHRPLPYIHIFD